MSSPLVRYYPYFNVIQRKLAIPSSLLELELDVFSGFDEQEAYLGNKRFEEFLVVLYLTGHIPLRKKFKDGYLLRYRSSESHV
ncbi:hypothetical protein PA598K_04042 [Paenibacillus sp. 598K]|nr:hypothetical protein PA598K_04042 [Paenibacillus sp. 598K]